MSGKLEGKVAFITGAGRGQGRSHAVRMAEEGTDIIAIDVCKRLDGVKIAMSTPDDLAETADQVEALGRRIHAVEADVRDEDVMTEVVREGVEKFGRHRDWKTARYTKMAMSKQIRDCQERVDIRSASGTTNHALSGVFLMTVDVTRFDDTTPDHSTDKGQESYRTWRSWSRGAGL
uniref:Short-chain dehydrogenase/reductase SDR n=1 Tax=Rhodococcus sp. NS1 TaxID=402236 RepID=A0A097SQW5_9NOCA|nr:hypothetical protein LRS1606.466 [Rhodococcus sp. NS1]